MSRNFCDAPIGECLLAGETERLEAENLKLKEALQDILEFCDEKECDVYEHWIARKVLNVGGG
jgi:hypothetical protein